MASGTGPGDLWGLANDLLQVCVDALDSIPLTVSPAYMAELDGAPEYAFVSDAAPIADCCDDGMLAVHVNGISDQFARPQQPSAPKANVPNLIVTVLRCLPLGEADGDSYTPPTVEELTASSRQVLADGWALWNHIYNMIRADLFLSPQCRRVVFGGMQSIRPGDGQCGGWQLSFHAELGGYESEIGT